LPREEFIGHLAQFYARLNYIHPFREGNGRTQRLFWGQVALHAGWTVDFVRMSKTANDEASRDASQDLGLEALIDLLDEITSPAPSVEQGEADLLTSVRREQEGQGFVDWVGSHISPDRGQ
jgi:cell filamentation protein